MGFAQAGNLASLLKEVIKVKGKMISNNLFSLLNPLKFAIFFKCFIT